MIPSSRRIRDAWKLSSIPYGELAYRSIQLTRGSMGQMGFLSGNRDPLSIFRKSVQSAKYSKGVMAVVGTVVPAIPFVQYEFAPSPYTLASSISLSLAISLGYLLLYSLQILPEFVSAETYSLLSTLPFERSDFNLVAFFSFLRTIDYITIGSTLSQVIAIFLVTRSLVAMGMMFVATLVNLVFAMTIALWLARLFYSNISSGGRSTGAKVVRIVFIATWGFAVMSMGFVFNFISYIIPVLNHVLSGNVIESPGLALLALHPFSIGITIASTVYPVLGTFQSFGNPVLFVPFIATFGYLVLALFAGTRVFRTITDITHGRGVRLIREKARELLFSVRTPLRAYAMKDLRVTSKNPATAFLFAAPIFEIVVVVLNLTQVFALRTSILIGATMIGSFFPLMTCLLLLNAEGTGMEYTLSLPITTRTMVEAKAFIGALIYAPIPIVLFLIQFARPLTYPPAIVIPFIELVSVASACLIVLMFFIVSFVDSPESVLMINQDAIKKRQAIAFNMMAGSNMLKMMEALVIGAIILAVPPGTYGITYLVTGSHVYSLLAIAVAALGEFALAIAILLHKT